MLRRPRVPSLPTALSLLALSIALTGTAFAATGQLVNLVDGSNPGNVAKVTSAGALSTTGTVTGNVGPAAPKNPFFFSGLAFIGTFNGQFQPTGATLAITGLRLANNTGGQVLLNIKQLPQSGATCNTSLDTVQIAQYVIPAGQTLIEPFTSPLVIRPPSTGKWCLNAVVDGTGNSGAVGIGYTGYVVSGTFTPPVSS